MKRFWIWVAALAVLVAACSSSATTPEPLALSLKASDIKFDQTTLEVTSGQPVKLTLTNTGVLEHDFNITEIPVSDVKQSGGDAGHSVHATNTADLHLAVKAGEMATLEFTPTTSGTYAFECTVIGHKELGMVGQLIVK